VIIKATRMWSYQSVQQRKESSYLQANVRDGVDGPVRRKRLVEARGQLFSGDVVQ